ncbi:S-adenosylmethionine:tRNA ribosyltransferase-isomerase, partial [Candidatus Woesearchaeota archaeon]|nr:S-adenosylmethionine:tRNA ribosyltransferase-isomerase [Candidatus Woesearchaeota archaeon]
MKLEEFNYHLPKQLIAHKPVFPKHNSRLMVVNEKVEHKHFYDILDYLKPDDVLVINETKVKRCKLRGKKLTGAPAEIVLLEELDNNQYKARIKTNKPKIGQKIVVDDFIIEIFDRDNDIFIIKFNKDISKKINLIGEFPFPTYIKRDKLEEREYQPIFAKHEGSVAA